MVRVVGERTRGPAPRARVAPCPAACVGGTLPRSQVPHLSSARGGLGRRRDPGPPRPCRPGCGTPGWPLPPGLQHLPAPEAPGEGGAALHVAGRRAAHVGSPRGPPLGCVCRPRARPGPGDPQGGWRPSLSPGRLGPAHLGSAPPPPALCAPGSARLGSARSGSAVRGRSRPGFGWRAAAPRAPR